MTRSIHVQGSYRVLQFPDRTESRRKRWITDDGGKKPELSTQLVNSLPLQRNSIQTSSVEDLIAYIVEVTGVSVDKLLSPAKYRYLTLPRALITAHGVDLGFSITELAHWLRRHPSTLIEGMKRYRSLHPQLFSADVTKIVERKQTEKLQELLGRFARGRN